MSTAPLSLGIDIGGTFTDLVIHDPRDGRAVIWKESTTPDDPARGAIEGTRRVLEKAGYVCEGRMRRSAMKEGVLLDQWLYAACDDTWDRVAAADPT